MSLNVISVSGRMATDPTIKDVNGMSCTSFNIASDSMKKDENGTKIPIFYSVSVWGQNGERAAKYLKKGNPVLIVGDFSQRTYTGNDGKDRFQNQIRASNVEYLGGTKQTQEAKTEVPEDELPF